MGRSEGDVPGFGVGEKFGKFPELGDLRPAWMALAWSSSD